MNTIGPRRLTVVSGCNSRYYLGLLVAFFSLARNLSKDVGVDFVVLADGLEESKIALLREVLDRAGRDYTLRTITVDLREFELLPKDYGASLMTYARLLIPKLILEDFVLYVDSDIVVQRDVSELWELAWPDGCLLWAARDAYIPTLLAEGANCELLGIPTTAPYFNAGWLWMNLKKWREDNVVGQCNDFMRRFPGAIRWWDQSVLNVVLWQHWRELDQSWNCNAYSSMGKLEVLPWAHNRNTNMHFLGRNKPWLAYNPYRHFFDGYYSEIADLIPEEAGYFRPRAVDQLRRVGFFARRGLRNWTTQCREWITK